MAFSGLWEGGIPTVFWHSGLYLGVFSTRTETDVFTGFSGDGPNQGTGNGARKRLIFPHSSDTLIPGLTDREGYGEWSYPPINC